jgi:histidinol-phosphate aminotransferase
MAKYEELIPEHIRALGGYIPGKPLRQAEQESGVSCIKMASNENPFGPSPRALEAMRQAAPTAHLYPDNEVTELRSRLIGRFRVEPDQLLITGGSTAFLNVIARTLLGPGRKAVTGERSFIVYPIVTRATGAQFVTVPMREDAFDLEAVLAAVDRDTRVVFLANPNNPTGTLLPPAEIERFLDRLPAHVVAVLDEAYSDFAEHFAAAKGVPYSRNVVVLHTFSKAHGLAGLRIGYGFAPAGLMQYFARMKTVFSVSALAEAAAVAALDDQAHIRLALENNAAGAKWLSERMAELGFRVVPTWGNFLYVDVGEDAAALAKRMEAAGVIIRPLTGAWGAPQAIRITIGTPDQNEKCISALKKVTARTVASG